MADRIDHFAAMRAEEEPTPEPEFGAPTATPALIAHLEAIFPPLVATGFAASQDGLLHLGMKTAESLGEQQVIAYLRTLVTGA